MKKFDLVLKGLDFNTVKKLSLILAFDISKEEKKEKDKGKSVKTDAQLLAEIETEIKNKKPKKK
jgi:hypothetical protein